MGLPGFNFFFLWLWDDPQPSPMRSITARITAIIDLAFKNEVFSSRVKIEKRFLTFRHVFITHPETDLLGASEFHCMVLFLV